MPVEDHPIHEKTVLPKDFRYLCHNSPRSPHYLAPDRIYTGIHYSNTISVVENKMSVECRYDQRHKDQACEGCRK